ncbi:hypothetical protein A3C86_01505 [Candidatus Kaiserbacteria bacterium RIFCSPHIGHO2_02_FULL_49_16]|uniref:Methyltransferase FkbM domain-containing protein n=1 Tax=Candidatus Kaiserbacteria bacterium RIFCSPHIGHO2_02_FULL_49_16 TaxID=1798490 RepID=A0A1F6DD09_9BACT|nr:MAG: hypothetical protein A3C86_01505 [Candidatus Kaiserbacteria bacterium RIFCSPHIGHO2_02_FULL_49_16]
MAISLRSVCRKLLSFSADTLARTQGFLFPEKFTWTWKFEMLLGRYEPETTAVFRKIIKPGMVVLDIGAHIGYFTRLFSVLAKANGKVYAFEADDANYSLLENNTRACRNTALVKKAVAYADGTVDFYHVENSTGCHSTIKPSSPAQKVSVLAVSIDSFAASKHIPRIDVIKMDIEGGEPSALRGMHATIYANPHIILISEFNPRAIAAGGKDPAAYIHEIESYGLSVHAITAAGLVLVSSDTIAEHLDRRVGSVNVLCKKI